MPTFEEERQEGDETLRPRHRGRGAQIRPVNRFEPVHLQRDASTSYESFAGVSAEQSEMPSGPFSDEAREQAVPTRYLPDASRSIVAENDSPDVGFRYSINPYRGCAHGCSYCYARPTHEYLGFDAGLDFETRILVKQDAAELFREWLSGDAWIPEPIALSGVTDCYQPAEREFGITRQILEVAWESRQPMMIITKNALVTRDGDLLRAMASERLVSVAISITSLDQSLTRIMEPRTSSPVARLEAIRQLAEWQIPTQVMVAPVIPGLNDHEVASILRAARAQGAESAGYVLLRLPGSVRAVFLDWLQQRLPLRAAKVEAAIRSVRDGQLSDSAFGRRQRGSGERAAQIAATFRVFSQQAGFPAKRHELNCTGFRPPLPRSGQLRLF